MSQHHFFTLHNNKKTHVLIGWDRPLQGFFLVIEKDGDQDEPFWSNLNLQESHPKSLQPFILVLSKLGFTIPDILIEEVMQDGCRNIGNKVVVHSNKHENYLRIEDVNVYAENLLDLYNKYGA
ncbi:MAG: hypothetical protein K2P99_03315 [Burkholderiales bacterium]|nr:hypothetical protein [Burkholderiales bacterium]